MRAEGKAWIGQPTLAQHVRARNAEMFLGDVLATSFFHAGIDVRNLVLAVNHPVRTLCRLVFRGELPKKTYASFPISGPRKLFSAGDSAGIENVNRWLHQVSDREKQNSGHVVFYPLTIDELPLEVILNRDGEEKDPVFRKQDRWDVSQILDQEKLLGSFDALPESIELPRFQTEQVIPLIKEDVRIRDFRLVLQSNQLLVWNPCFDGEETGGVGAEIDCALLHHIPVYIFQDPSHDPDGKILDRYVGKGGSLGGKLSSKLVKDFDDESECLNVVFA